MSESNDPREMQSRIADLEAKLKQITMERDLYKESANLAASELFPFVPPTEEELEDILHGPRDGTISEAIEQLEREFGYVP